MNIDDAGQLGFGADQILRDSSQMRFVAALARQGAERFVLKGGMAMRSLYGSTRLTKDVDLDCDPKVSMQSMQKQMGRALMSAALEAGAINPKIDQTKTAVSTNRWRLQATTAEGVKTNWDVEVSARGLPPAQFLANISFNLPRSYGIAPFNVRAYSPSAMAAAKVAALMSANRNVPRDVYDLHELIAARASPVEVFVQSASPEILKQWLHTLMQKVDAIGFKQATSELLPFIAPAVRDTVTEGRWDEIRLGVADRVSEWLHDAIGRLTNCHEKGNGSSNIATGQ